MQYHARGMLFVISLLLLISCTSPEYKQALTDYESAKSTKDIKKLSVALKKLARFAPEEFRNESIKAEEANSHLQTAEAQQELGNNYAAYVASHNSYRSIPNSAAKKILVQSGKTLLPLLKATLSIEKSFDIRTKKLQQQIENNSNLPIRDWDLISINSSIEKLSIAINELETANTLIMAFKAKEQKIPNLNNWQHEIDKQQLLLKKIRDHFANLARYHSANLLKALNESLTSESIKLLALVRPKFAQESMQKKFNQSQEQYSAFANIVENVALAEDLTKKDKHAAWYRDWHNIETSILEPKGNFKNYPISSKNRTQQLSTYLNNNRIQLPLLTTAFNNKVIFSQEFQEINELTSKLKIDKALIF